MANSDMLVRVLADTKNYDANLSKASKTLKQFADNNLSMSGVLKQTTSALTGMAAQVLSVAAAIGAAKKVMGDMVRINMQFEQGTSVLASIMGKTTDEIASLTNQAKQLGATTRYTAMQITELQTNLARLGFNESEILNSTKAVQALATATGADLGEAANLAGAALRGFGMNSTEMERATSVLAVSTTKSALSFEKLATAVPIVAPVAKQFGFTIEDTVTLLGKLSDAGMDASSAATATRNIFLKMADSGGKLSQAMGRPVHSVEEFGEALKEMREKGMSLNDILKMVGVRSTAAFAVFADNADTLKDFKQSITDCSEEMHNMESKQINTLQGSVTILNSAWEGLMLTFSESNGVIKTVVDNLSELLQTWTKWRNRNAGGDAAIKTYEMAESEVAKYGKQYIEGDRAAGMSDSAIKKNAEAEKAAIEEEIVAMKEVLKLWEEAEGKTISGKAKDEVIPKVQEVFGDIKGGNWTEQMRKIIASKQDNIAINDYIISALTAPSATAAPSDSGGGVGGTEKDLTSKRRAQIEAQMQEDIAALDKANMIKEGKEAEYEDNVYQIKRAALEQIKQLYAEDSKEYAQVRAKIAQLDIAYQGKQANKGKSGSGKDPELTALEKRNKRIQELTSSIAEMNNILATSTDENEKAWATNQLQAYNDELDRLNGKLKETATNVTELPTKFEILQASLDKMSTGVGAISTLGNSFNELKSIGDDLAAAFSGEMDSWDALMTVFNSGIGIMETVIGVMEAINTLQELSSTLSKKKVTDQATETAAVVSGKMAESTANVQEAGTSMLSAGANTAESSTAAGKAVANIPIVGPILAVAAIAAVLGAAIAAMSKAKSAGHFSGGGMILGNSYSGDNLTANVNSGELILNRAQQSNIAGQLQNNNPLGNLQLTSKVRGSDLLIVLDNTNSSRGGQRGMYVNVR